MLFFVFLAMLIIVSIFKKNLKPLSPVEAVIVGLVFLGVFLIFVGYMRNLHALRFSHNSIKTMATVVTKRENFEAEISSTYDYTFEYEENGITKRGKIYYSADSGMYVGDSVEICYVNI